MRVVGTSSRWGLGSGRQVLEADWWRSLRPSDLVAKFLRKRGSLGKCRLRSDRRGGLVEHDLEGSWLYDDPFCDKISHLILGAPATSTVACKVLAYGTFFPSDKKRDRYWSPRGERWSTRPCLEFWSSTHEPFSGLKQI